MFLMHLCKGDAEARVQSAEEGNGLEAWRLLCYAKLPKSATAAFSSTMEPTFINTDPRLNMQARDREALRYEQRFEEISDAMRKSVCQNKIAPVEVQQHLMLNATQFTTGLCKDCDRGVLRCQRRS